MKAGSVLICPSFLGIAEGQAKLSNWKPTNADDYVFGEINFESLDEFGRSKEGTTFMYLDPTFAGDPTACEWVDGDMAPADKIFGPGEAVWMSLPGDDEISPVNLVDAGAVNEDDILITLVEGSNAIGNFMAVNYPISDIEVIGAESYVFGEVNFESLDEFGRSKDGTTFMYLDPTFEGNPENCEWVDGDMAPVTADMVLAPGQSVWFSSPEAGIQLKFYAPDL